MTRGHIQMVSPMWPSQDHPHTGVFVRNLTDALIREGFTVEAAAVIRGQSGGVRQKLRNHFGLGVDLARAVPRPADILYVHAPTWFSPVCEWATQTKDKRLVVHVHGGEAHPHSRMERYTQSWVGRLVHRADLVVCPSAYYQGEMQHTFGSFASCIFPSGGVDTARFVPQDRTEARLRLGLPKAAVILGFVGRLEDDKGWDVFLETLGRLAQTGENVFGVVVGDGRDASRARQCARTLGVNASLHWAGLVPQTDLPPYYAAMNVFLFPTRRGAEALGLVPLEAMACGIPVVGPQRYAVPEYVRKGAGRVVAPREVRAYVQAVKEIVHGSDRARMAQAARSIALEYDTNVVTRTLARRLDALLAPS